MYLVVTLSADGSEAGMPKFFERLPDARSYARLTVQSAERAHIYDVVEFEKPSVEVAIEVMITRQPIEIIGRHATDKEIDEYKYADARAWFRALGKPWADRLK
jgi:hypothetical protein